MEMPPHCAVCLDSDRSLSLRQGVSWLALLESANGQCRNCQLLAKLIPEFRADGEPWDAEHVVVGWDTMRIQGLRVVVGTRRCPTQSDPSFVFSLDAFALPGDPVPWCAQKRGGEQAMEIPSHTGSDQAISTIEAWIRCCQEEHDCFEGAASEPLLPKRVVDVSYSNSIRLFCPPPGTRSHYACLSHCWGKTLMITTRSDNLISFQTSIPWECLPPTFQDAIRICRRLRIAYIWIDALCIVQDSKADWAAESTKMSSIYSSAYLTIAASGASSNASGFLREAPRLHRARAIEYTTPSGETATIHARRTLTHGQGPEPLPLLRRAWVLQERLLSPRVVHFAPEELIWECMNCTRCSCGCIRALWSPGFVPFRKDLLHRPLLERSVGPAETRKRWQWLVSEYSRLLLTLQSDRLPAISGAARRFAEVWGGPGNRYVAGCWRQGMLKDLMWRRLEPDLHKAKRLHDVPTWSWAGTEAYVSFDEAMSTTLEAHVVSTSMDADGLDYFGVDEKEVILQVSGRIRRLELRDDGICTLDPSQGAEGSVFLNDSAFTPDSVNVLDGARELICLKLATMFHLLGEGTNQQVSLVLKPARGRLFERVGILRIQYTGPLLLHDIYNSTAELTTIEIT